MRALRPALLLALAAPLAAQPVDRSQLPSLTPAVFESRGTVAVTLPRVERQPLSGFGPLPRRFQVAADRQPTQLPFAPDPDALPALALAPPVAPAASDLVVRRLRVEGGGGTESAAYGRVDLAAAGVGGEFFVDADFDRVRVPASTDTDFETIALRAGGQSYGPGRLSIEGFAARELVPAAIGERTRRLAGAELGVEGVGATAYRAAVGFETGSLEADAAETSETRIDATARLARGAVAVDAAGGVSTGDAEARYGVAGLAGTFGRPGGTRGTVGARILALYDATVGGPARDPNGVDGTAVTVGPILDLALPLGPTVSAFLTNDPHVAPRSLGDLSAANPYVRLDAVTAPDVVQVDARVGIAAAVGRSRARVFALAFRAPTFLAFEQRPAPTGPQIPGGNPDFDALYLDVSAFGLGADVALVGESGLSASASLAIRAGQTADGEDIPYWSPLVATAGVQVPFARGRGRVGASVHVEGSRPIDRAASADAPSYALVSAEASYAVLPPLAVVARAEHLAGEAEVWPVFEQRPRAFLLGVRLQR